MTAVHDFGAALRGKLRPLPSAREHLSHMADAAKWVVELVRRDPRNESSAVDIDATGALVADWAAQLAILVDEEQRVSAQYIRRLAEMMREQARSSDTVRIEVLAWAILRAVDQVGDPLDGKRA